MKPTVAEMLRDIALAPDRGNGPPKPIKIKGPIVSSRGLAEDAAAEAAAGGIASPIIENEHVPTAPEEDQVRRYYPVRNFTSSDGLLSIEYENLYRILMTDDNGDLVEFQFRDPDA